MDEDDYIGEEGVHRRRVRLVGQCAIIAPMSTKTLFPFLHGLVFFAIFWIAIFLPAGTVNWIFGWLFWGSFFVFFMGMTAWLTVKNPGLAQERTKLSSYDQKKWDKPLFLAMLIVPLVWLVIISLDACRFHWTYIPFWLHMIGLVLLFGSFFILALVFRENSFLSPVVRLQTDRKQHAISTGPYAIVRHPMYSALTLKNELEGYGEYMVTVRFRMIPGIW